MPYIKICCRPKTSGSHHSSNNSLLSDRPPSRPPSRQGRRGGADTPTDRTNTGKQTIKHRANPANQAPQADSQLTFTGKHLHCCADSSLTFMGKRLHCCAVPPAANVIDVDAWMLQCQGSGPRRFPHTIATRPASSCGRRGFHPHSSLGPSPTSTAIEV